jgi:hypothetical protein
MADFVVKMTGDEAQLWASMQRIVGGTRELQRGFENVGKASRQAAQEQKVLEAAGKRVWDETRTPMERHNQRLQDLGKLLQGRAIDQETYGRAVKKSEQALADAGKAQEKMLGGGVMSELTSLAAGYVSVGAAVGLATKALTEMNQVSRDAADKLRETRFPRGGLAQVAGSPEELKQLEGLANKLRESGGAESTAEAMGIVKFLKQKEGLALLPVAGAMKRTGLVEKPLELLERAHQLSEIFGQGTPAEMKHSLDLVMAVGKPRSEGGTGEGGEEVAAAAVPLGTEAARAGWSQEELMAGMAESVKFKGGARKARVGMKELLGHLPELRLQSKGLEANLAEIAGKGWTERTMRARLGNEGYDYVMKALAGSRAVPQGTVEDLKGVLETSGAGRTISEGVVAEGEQEIARQEGGRLSTRAKTAQKEVETWARRLGGREAEWGAGLYMSALRLVMGDEELGAGHFAQFAVGTTKRFAGPFGAAFLPLQAAAEKLDAAADKLMRRAPSAGRNSE